MNYFKTFIIIIHSAINAEILVQIGQFDYKL